MSGNQNRGSARSGGAAGHHRGYSGSGAKGGRGPAAVPPSASSSSGPQPSLNANRSFNNKKINSNAQGGPPLRQNPSSALNDTNSGFAPATPPKGATPNGSQSHFQPPPPSHAATNNVPKPGTEKPNQPNNPSQTVPRGPPQPNSRPPPSSSMPPLPSKGDLPKGPAAVPLQFGTINMGMMNGGGLQIPARTNSAPPNLVEQKRNQALHEAMKGGPSHGPQFPIPSGPRPQIPQPRKEPPINTSTGAIPNPVHQIPPQSHPPPQPKQHIQAPPIQPVPVSMPIQVQAPIPSQPLPQQIPVPYQHQMQVPFPHQQPQQMQVPFGGHNPQLQANSMQMPMSLPMGSAPPPQVPPQMFVHQGLHHQHQQQALLHQSQSMGFAPVPPGHQLGPPPQLSNLGLSMGPQFPGPSQQQGNKYPTARKTTSVRITHPDTLEEVKLDNVATNLRSMGGNVITGHPGQMPNFPHMGYYPGPQVQAGGYNPQMYFGNPGNMPQMGGGSQQPRFPYTVTQTGQPVNFMQPQNKPVPNTSSSENKSHGEAVLATSRPTVTITNPNVKVTKPSETGTKTVSVGADNKQTGTVPLVDKKPEVKPAVPVVEKKPEVKPAVPSPEEKPAVPVTEEKKSDSPVKEQPKVIEPEQPELDEEDKKPLEPEQPKLEKAVSEEAEEKKETVVPKEEQNANGNGKAPKVEEEKPAIIEEKEVEIPAKVEEAKPEKPIQGEEKQEETKEEVEPVEIEPPIVKELEKIAEEPVTVQEISEKPSPTVEPKQAEETAARPNSSTSTMSTDSDSVSSVSSISHTNGNSSKGLLDLPAKSKSKSKDNNKPVAEAPKRPESSKKKKKRKEIFSKADAAGSSDLYNAYKGPEETKPTTSTVTPPADVSKVTALAEPVTEKDAASSLVLEDWEDVADKSTTPKLPPHITREIPTKKTYSRDFMLTLAQQCNDFPPGFQPDSSLGSLIMGNNNHNNNRGGGGGYDQSYPSPSRGSRGGDRRLGNSASFGPLDDDRWTRSPGQFSPGPSPNMNLRPGQGGPNYGAMKYPRGAGPAGGQNSNNSNNNQNNFGILSPMPGGHGGSHRGGSEMDRWQHISGGSGMQRGLIPSPVASPHQVMHKADIKYVVGKVSDEEQAKQRQLKGILNKLTPQNFEKLFEQVKEVNIDNPVTLAGVISQIFDKALMEPTFCEMYANFCSQLATALPDFSENNEKITFKRLLLNKCQEEFERGEREEAEAADQNEEEGESKQTPEEREEKRLKTKRRMLGNIRLIGELYKKRMLTERIMHECIKKLLGPYQNPDEEDIEALCKLMSTIGEMIDHPKAKEHMDAYFDLITKLSTNQKYPSRVRFMLKDTMDLRRNRWQQRRKVDGPKKIEDVHRDAAQERQTRLPRGGGPIMNNPPMRRGGAGMGGSLVSPILQQSASMRGMAPNNRMQQDIRYEERGGGGDRYQFDNNSNSRNVNVSLPVTHRETLTFGPQGGLGRNMSIRGGQPILSSGPNGSSGSDSNSGFGSRLASPDERTGPSLGEGWSSSRNMQRNYSTGTTRLPVPSPQAVPQAVSVPPSPSSTGGTGLPDSTIKEKSISAIREYFSALDEKEVKLCIEEMNSPGSYHLIISTWVNDSFERKVTERNLVFKLLLSLSKPEEGFFNQSQLLRGFEVVLSTLDDAMSDAPKAPEYLGELFSKLVMEGSTPLKEIGRLVLQGGEELIEAGIGGDLIGCILECIKKEKGDSYLGEIRAESNLKLEDFKPALPLRSKKLEPFL